MSDFFDFVDDSSKLHFLEAQQQSQRIGVRLAVVTNITDPKNLNRVKVKPLAEEDDKNILESDWCPVIMPLSGKECGIFLMPGIDDIVLVAYLEGDPNCPYVIGGTWNQDSAAPYTVTDGKNFNFSIKTPGGSELLFYDEKDKEYILLNTPKKAEFRVDDEQKTASFTDPEKKNSISLNWEKGELTVTADQKITFTAGKASITMEGSGKITIKADNEVNIESAAINSKASNASKVTGSSVEVSASGKLTLKGASADLKGSSGVNIN